MRQVWAMLLVVGLVGCGVDDGKRISEFSDEDVESFCEEIGAASREVTCDFEGNSITFEVNPSYEECVSTYDPSFYAGCDLTAGDVRGCYDAFAELSDGEYCELGTDYPEACEPLYSCVLGG